MLNSGARVVSGFKISEMLKHFQKGRWRSNFRCLDAVWSYFKFCWADVHKSMEDEKGSWQIVASSAEQNHESLLYFGRRTRLRPLPPKNWLRELIVKMMLIYFCVWVTLLIFSLQFIHEDQIKKGIKKRVVSIVMMNRVELN